jgi:hypothetical protein
MFKNWTWQQWVGKFLLLAVALVELAVKELALPKIPWWPIIGTGVTWVAQFVIGWLPGEAWQRVVGKGLLMGISLVELVLNKMGLQVPIWAIIVPAATAFAQYLISQVPAPAPASEAPASS